MELKSGEWNSCDFYVDVAGAIYITSVDGPWHKLFPSENRATGAVEKPADSRDSSGPA